MSFETFKISSHHLPSIGFEAGMLEELAVAGGIGLQLRYLLQQGAVVTIWVPKEDSVVVEHVGFRVTIGAPVNGDATGAYGVEYFLGDITFNGGVLGTDVELILLEELGLVVVVFCLEFISVVEELTGAVDRCDGVEALNQPCATLSPRIISTAVAGDQGAEAVAHGGIPLLVAQLVADALDVIDR